ncbi:MAG: hypothetical protein AB1746_16070, partial [Candidatus Zixiibacteriota bacterium]
SALNAAKKILVQNRGGGLLQIGDILWHNLKIRAKCIFGPKNIEVAITHIPWLCMQKDPLLKVAKWCTIKTLHKRIDPKISY